MDRVCHGWVVSIHHALYPQAWLCQGALSFPGPMPRVEPLPSATLASLGSGRLVFLAWQVRLKCLGGAQHG